MLEGEGSQRKRPLTKQLDAKMSVVLTVKAVSNMTAVEDRVSLSGM